MSTASRIHYHALALFSLLLLVSCSLFLPHLSFARTSTAFQLQPDFGHFDAIGRLPASLSSGTAVIGGSWREVVYIYAQESNGQWPLLQKLNIQSDQFALAEDSLIIVSDAEYLPYNEGNTVVARTEVNFYHRSTAGIWNLSKTTLYDGRIASVKLNAPGTSAVLLQSDMKWNSGGDFAEVLQLTSDNQWSTVQKLSIDGNAAYRDPSLCISDDLLIVDETEYRKESGDWVMKSGLDFVGLEAPSILSSADCRKLAVRSGLYPDYDISVFGLDGKDWIPEILSISPEVQWQSFALNDKLLIAITDDSTVTAFHNRGGSGGEADWIELQDLWFEPRREPGSVPYWLSVSLSGASVLIGSPVTGKATIHELDQHFESGTAGSLPFEPECTRGYSDLDFDGNGWEDERSCTVPEEFINPLDSRRSLYLQVDESFQNPGSGPVAWDDGLLVVPRLVSDPLTLDLDIYRSVEPSSWELDSELTITLDYDPQVQEFYSDGVEFEPENLAIDIDGNTLVVGVPLETEGQEKYTGRIYIFDKRGGLWELKQTFYGVLWSSFGSAVSIDADVIAVRSTNVGGEGGSDGTIHFYKRNSEGKWSLDTELENARGWGSFSPFGYSIDLQGDTLILANRNVETRLGIIDVLKHDDQQGWQPHQVLYAGDGYDHLRAAIDGDYITIEESGKLHLYKRDANDYWNKLAVFTGSDLVIRRNRVWKTDPPVYSPERRLNYFVMLPSDQWKPDRVFYPVSFNIADHTSTGLSITEPNPADSLQAEPSSLQSDEIPDDSELENDLVQNSVELQGFVLEERTGGGGGFVALHVLLLFLATMHGRRRILAVKS